MSTSFLIAGATGKQGRATIASLLSHPSFSPTSHTIYAITRDPSSSSAQRLAARSPAIKLISGNLDSPGPIFKSLPTPPTAVFSVQGVVKDEVAQGTGLIDAAIAASTASSPLKRYVQTSVERGGEGPTNVPHFATKYKIEQHLEKAAAQNGFSYTILRPVFFLDNLDWGFFGKIVATSWRDNLKPGQKLQVVDTRDIGAWAADALMGEPAEPVAGLSAAAQSLENKKISLAGDELSFEEANTIFKEETGQDIQTTFSFVSTIFLWMVKDMGLMYNFFREQGFSTDFSVLKASGRKMTTLRDWTRQSSFVKQSK